MATPRIRPVRQTKQLLYYAEPPFIMGLWTDVLQQAVREFNLLSRHHGLGVTLTRSGVYPDTVGGGDADIAIWTAMQSAEAEHAGKTQTEVFDGAGLHGLTLTFVRVGSGIEKAFIFLPEKPSVLTPQGEKRPVGPKVMLVIAVHELFHACGLEDNDHCPDDLFCGHPTVDVGSKPLNDRIMVVINPGKRQWYRFMPPLYLAPITARRLRQLW